ncbi:hypothetical protein Pdw03_2626 [Penicillium digitatum]|uniref:Uncharacterized protein n=1 Tax=Penicillium digitatum TaxID=36651 RepID=A0A7T7BHB9_PENDI|nr:hypothetical protein Pdw03_2626 [Penicillium digitatum]
MFLSLIPRKAPGTSRIKLLGLPQIHRGKPFSPKKINKISPVTHCASRALVPRADNRKAQVAENTKQETFPLFQLDISTKTFGVADKCSTDESCDEEEEERDTLGPRIALSPQEYGIGDTLPTTRGDPENFDIPAKSPPLSVTSRMCRCSLQSSATDPTASTSGGTNSRRTSFTASSSISASSMPSSTPRVAYNTPKHPPFPEKRYPSRTKHREPESGPRQEMVPSYDELYG